MKFLLLMAEENHFANWETADDAHHKRVYADFRAFDEAVRSRGRVVGGEALDRPSTARTVRPRPDRAGTDCPVTEGPFAETVEQVGGFYLIDVPDMDTAVELAALLPREYTVEVRPTLEVEL
ncbi:MAG TPA: YciI family protein [Nocardioides sp.]|uniref:YciI family protein n=1 Tax=Nocardioides sp. TaxID=35761 RepID=UPI002E360ACE|nr:YciI family protein [Nocardioides sp.]HEX5086191.1 YciI family protein [Nocardioides sp.]